MRLHPLRRPATARHCFTLHVRPDGLRAGRHRSARCKRDRQAGRDRPDAPRGTFAVGLAHAVAVERIQESLGGSIPRAAHAENHAILSGTQRVVPGLLDAMKAAAAEERLVDLQLLGA